MFKTNYKSRLWPNIEMKNQTIPRLAFVSNMRLQAILPVPSLLRASKQVTKSQTSTSTLFSDNTPIDTKTMSSTVEGLICGTELTWIAAINELMIWQLQWLISSIAPIVPWTINRHSIDSVITSECDSRAEFFVKTLSLKLARIALALTVTGFT